MKNIIVLLVVILMAATVSAQEKSGQKSFVTVTIGDPVTFKELLVAGASTEPLVPYSAYGAARSATFNFANVTVGKMKNCMYTIRCENGKIAGIFLTVQDAEACRELEAYATARFGEPVRESLSKKDGVVESANYIFDAGGIKANLSVVTDKHASLVMN